MLEKIKKLTEPWSKDEIKWRVGSMTKDKDKALPLAYIDARTVMERLDSVVGPENWQDHYEFHGTRTVCRLSIRIGDEWITKCDGAGDSDIEAEKGGISDAFKRAAVKWGMGRELYELKCKWMPVNKFKQLEGDPWKYVIDGDPELPKPELPEFDIEAEYQLCIKQIAVTQLRSEFVKMWNSPESKSRRAKINSINQAYYAEINAKMKERMKVFEEDEKRLLKEFEAA